MRARKVDNNQREIVEQMRQIGMSVFVTSSLGDSFPDVVCGYRGINYLFEIKDGKKPPSHKRLKPGQEKFFDGWQGKVYKVESFDDVLSIVNSKA